MRRKAALLAERGRRNFPPTPSTAPERSAGAKRRRQIPSKVFHKTGSHLVVKIHQKNMKIIICGSITAALEILEIKARLESVGHEVEIPHGVKHEEYWKRTEIATSEKAGDKIKNDVIRAYYEKIKNHDAVLVVNVEKRGIKNYIGGNTFLEMGFAHVLNKKLFCLNPLPDLPYTAELEAMEPIILNGNLQKLK